jgi:hypothetical protein
MILGISVGAFTILHVTITLVAIPEIFCRIGLHSPERRFGVSPI